MSPAISSALDETIAALDALNRSTEARKRSDADTLRAFVGRLGDPFEVDQPDVVVAREGRGQAPRIGGADPTPDPEPFVPLPRTTTKPWGALMREKFRREALERGGW
jgi:hypothetical protein